MLGLLVALLRLPDTAAERALRAGVAPSGVLLPVPQAVMDAQQVHDSGLDPAHYVWPPTVAALLNDDWTGRWSWTSTGRASHPHGGAGANPTGPGAAAGCRLRSQGPLSPGWRWPHSHPVTSPRWTGVAAVR